MPDSANQKTHVGGTAVTHVSSPHASKQTQAHEENTDRNFGHTTGHRIHSPCATRCCLYGARAAFLAARVEMFQKAVSHLSNSDTRVQSPTGRLKGLAQFQNLPVGVGDSQAHPCALSLLRTHASRHEMPGQSGDRTDSRTDYPGVKYRFDRPPPEVRSTGPLYSESN